jgi:hypothetical protein
MKLRLPFIRAKDALVDLVKTSKFYRWTALASLVLVVLTFAVPAWKIVPIRQAAPYIPLHYNIYIGIDRFGPWYYVFIPGVLGLTLLFVNTVFQAVFYRREKVLSAFFAVATAFAELTLFVAMALSVLLNL